MEWYERIGMYTVLGFLTYTSFLVLTEVKDRLLADEGLF